jgi:hypothetical protein
MAPESERATCGKQMTAWNPGAGAVYCNADKNHGGDCSYTFTYQTNPPTLTCSEVVERLQAECLEIFGDDSGLKPVLNAAKATAILHSWRERRVQELSGSEICRRQAEYFAQLIGVE